MPKPSKETKPAEPKKAEPEADETEEVEVNAEDEVENVTCPDFDVKQLYFKAQEPDKDATQLMCFPKYIYDPEQPLTPENFEKNGKSVILVTKPIKMIKGGIPRHNAKYHGNDLNSMKRAYFYIPKNDKDENSMELFECIQRIDDYMVDEINTKGNEAGILCVLNSKGKRIKLKGITYSRMITTAKPGSDLDLGEGDDDEDDKPKKGKKGAKDTGKKEKKEFVPWDRIKVKFSTDWDENLGPNDIKDINTQIYVGDKETAENCKTVTDFEKHFMWNCTAQYALMMNKVWIKKTDDKACSIGIKCIQIGVTEQPEFKKNTSISKQLNKRLFASSGPLKVTPSEKTNSADEEDEDNKVVTKDSKKGKADAKAPAKPAAKPDAKATKADAKAPAKPAGKAAAKKADTEDEDNDEDEDKDEDADDKDEDEDKDEDAEDNEDASEPESEDEKPAPKGKKATPAKADVKVKGKAVAKSGSNASGKKPAPKKAKK